MNLSKLYIGRLSASTTKEELGTVLERFGVVKNIDFKVGFAFVQFSSAIEAENAKSGLDGKELNGSSVCVSFFKEKEEARPTFRKGAITKKNDGFRVYVRNLNDYITWSTLKDFGREAGEVVYAERNYEYGVIDYLVSSIILCSKIINFGYIFRRWMWLSAQYDC